MTLVINIIQQSDFLDFNFYKNLSVQIALRCM